MRFGSPFVFSLPTMTVITLTTTAPGYEPSQEVMKPHYRRNVTLTIDIPLAPMPTNSRGSRKDGTVASLLRYRRHRRKARRGRSSKEMNPP